METVVIAGGAGFLGSHLCERFLNEGMTVYCLDNLCTGRMENIEHLGVNDRFHFLKINIYETIVVPGKVDYVLNFASPASPFDYLAMPIQTMKVGSIGTMHALGLAKAKRARFLLASTSECYGDPAIHPQPEDYWGNVNPVGPRGVYDEAKRFAEALTMAYHRQHGVDTRIVRIFNTYGPRMRLNDGRALPNFMCQALKNEDVTVFGDGKQTRSFQYVDDLVEGIWRLVHSDEVYPVNIGNPEEVSLLDFAKEIIELTGSSSKIIFQNLPENDPKVRQPDIAKAKRILDWMPKVKRSEGLQVTLDYFKKELGLS